MRTLVGTALGSVMLLCGCYGSTEPATDVRPISATLNGAGSTESSPTSTWFEYWRTAQPGAVTRTDPRNLPGGVSGPVKAGVGDTLDVRDARLVPATEYGFRLCGAPEGGAAACAQTRTFRTPEGDVVEAVLHASDVDAWLRASSGPSGESARGLFDVMPLGSPEERVVCLSVHGDEAVVGTRAPSGSSQRTVGLLAGLGHRITQDMSRDPTKCAEVTRGDMPLSTITADTSIHDGS